MSRNSGLQEFRCHRHVIYSLHRKLSPRFGYRPPYKLKFLCIYESDLVLSSENFRVPDEAIATAWGGAVCDPKALQPKAVAHEPGQLVGFQIQAQLLNLASDREPNPRIDPSTYSATGTVKAEGEPLQLIRGAAAEEPVHERGETVELDARARGCMEVHALDVRTAMAPPPGQGAELDDILGGHEGEDSVHQMIGQLAYVVVLSSSLFTHY